jgi:hypothetical protein
MDLDLEHLETFGGLPVHTFAPDRELADPASHAIRVALDWGASDQGVAFLNLLGELLAHEAAARSRALVLGVWEFNTSPVVGKIVHLLASNAGRLPALDALFFGDIVREELEISWIRQGDITPLFAAFPRLRTLRVRGSNDLEVDTIRHAHLEELAFETSGLPRTVLQSVGEAELPKLRHLELWLGCRDSGWDGSVEDLAPILVGTRFPELRSLGLKNSVIQDQVAAAVASSPILGQLETLDLSLGTLGERGARALLAAPDLGRLRRLDIHHHHVPDDLVAELRNVVPEVDASDWQDWNDYGQRYVALWE